IVTALELLKFQPDSPRRASHLQMIERQAHQLTRLVEDVLDVSRLARGKVSLRWSDVSVVDVVAQAVETVGAQLERNRHRLRIDVDPKLALRADPIRLTQIFANLLSNAVRYSGEGSEIAVRSQRSGEQLLLTVSDDGTGISAELLSEIFEPFTQGKRSLDRIHGGLGLGLTLVKSLAELHGGTATARSDGHGKGASFTVTLPANLIVQSSQPFGFEESTSGVHAPAAQRLALVVDDNVDAADSLCEALEMWGYATLRAHDGETALAIALEKAPDVVMLDIGLPGLDGYEIARRLHAQPRACPKIVGVSGYGREIDQRLSADAGFDVHLVKPVQLSQLREALDRLLS
ncbi:MAG: ATP-binding protein, partial [Myxococcaceae bacterium]